MTFCCILLQNCDLRSFVAISVLSLLHGEKFSQELRPRRKMTNIRYGPCLERDKETLNQKKMVFDNPWHPPTSQRHPGTGVTWIYKLGMRWCNFYHKSENGNEKWKWGNNDNHWLNQLKAAHQLLQCQWRIVNCKEKSVKMNIKSKKKSEE